MNEIILFLAIVSIILYLFCLLFLSNRIKYSIKIFVLIIEDVILFFSILLKHFYDIVWIFTYTIIILLLIINIVSSIIFLIKYYKKIYIIKLIIPIISIILLLSGIADKIDLKIGLTIAKYKLENVLKDECYISKYNIRELDNGIYAFVYKTGIIDPWIGIVYDNSGALESVFENYHSDEKYNGLKNYQKLKQYISGFMWQIKKLEDNWYLCYFSM
jgi:hypothetical protein